MLGDYIKQYKKRIIIGGSIFLVVCAVITFWNNYAVVNVEISGRTATERAGAVTYANTDTESAVAGRTGILLIPRSTKSLTVALTKSIKTQTPLDIPWIGIANKKVSFQTDVNADKIAYQNITNTPCGTYSKNLNRMLAYDCTNPVTLTDYQAPQNGYWGNKKLADINFTNRKATPYLGGVIGVAYVPNSDVITPQPIGGISETGGLYYYNAPNAFNLSTLPEATIVTDTTDATNNRFLLITKSGDVYMGTPTPTNTVEYILHPAPKDYDSTYQQTLCSLTGDKVFCYRGEVIVGDSDAKNLPSSISQFIFGQDTSEEVATDLPIIDEFFSTIDGKLYAKQNKKLFVFNKTGNKYTARELAQNVDSVSAGQGLYITQNNGVFKAASNGTDFHQLFYSKNLAINSVYQSENKIFAIASTAGIKGIYGAYLLNDSSNTTPGQRLIDNFPISYDSLPNVSNQDLVGDRLYIAIRYESMRQSDASRAVDPGKFIAAQAEIKEFLKSRDIDVNSVSLQFVY